MEYMLTTLFTIFRTNCWPCVLSMSGKCDVVKDRLRIQTMMSLLEQVQVLNKLDKWISNDAVRHLYTANESTINYTKKNEDKIKRSIHANAPPEWLLEEALAPSTYCLLGAPQPEGRHKKHPHVGPWISRFAQFEGGCFAGSCWLMLLR
jgi:hypothetical protein